MPRNVRNWWIEVTIDGRTSRIAAGPQSKDGGFSMRILQRSKGDIVESLSVWGIAQRDRPNVLTLCAESPKLPNSMLTVETER